MAGRREFFEGAYMAKASTNLRKFTNHDKYLVAREIFIQNGARLVFDLGCGEGSYMAFCAEKGIRCKGMDVSATAVKAAVDLGLEVLCANIDEQDIPLESESVDGVFCAEVIEHVFDTDHLLNECARILKPGGILIITTPNLASWFNRLLLLFGYQPMNTEVSLRHIVGHPFPFWNVSGHIHVFTKRALVQLLVFHPSLRVVKFIRFGTTELGSGYRTAFRVAAKIGNSVFRTSSLSSDLFVVLEKNPTSA